MNITVVTLHPIINSRGGSAKVFFELVNNLTKKGHSVTGICYDPKPGLPAFKMDNLAKFINCCEVSEFKLSVLNCISKLFSCFCLSRKNRRISRTLRSLKFKSSAIGRALNLSAPDVIISFQQETTYLIREILKIKIPLITSIHRDPSEYFAKPEFTIYKKALEECEAIQVLTKDFVGVTKKFIQRTKVVCIPNVVPQFNKCAKLENPLIITVGRISSIKRQALIIEAFSLISQKYKEWRVEMWGENSGQYAQKLENLISKKGLGAQVKLCGETGQVIRHLEQASIFVFPSLREGFSLALTEAMAMGIPVIGCSDCPSVCLLVKDERSGFVCESKPEAIAAKLEILMKDKLKRLEFGGKAKIDMKPFSMDAVLNLWDALLVEVTE